MKNFLLMAGAAAVLTFSACKKDKDNDNNNGGGEKKVKKITKTEAGQTIVYTVNYNGNKMSSYANADNSEYTKFTYDNAGNVTKVEVKEEDEYSTFTYTYQNGIPVSGTLKVIVKTAGEPDDVQQDETFAYTVTNNQVTKIVQHDNVYGTDLEADLSYQPNGNLAKAQLFGVEEYNIVYTFGTKKAPFPAISKWVLDLGASVEFSAKNELITTLMDFEGDDYDMEFTSTYTYDAAGYPLTSSTMGTTLKFEY